MGEGRQGEWMESLNVKMVEELGQPFSFKKGDYVFKQGQILEDIRVFYVLDGEVVVRRKYTSLKFDEFRFRKGDVFGILEAYLGRSRVTEAQCASDAKLMGFNRAGMETLLASNMPASLGIIRGLSNMLRQVNGHIKELPA